VVDGRGKEEDERGCGCWFADCIEKMSGERRKKTGTSACCVACWLEKERETQMVLVCLSIGEGKGWSCCWLLIGKESTLFLQWRNLVEGEIIRERHE
jgi:hypothetical protein